MRARKKTNGSSVLGPGLHRFVDPLRALSIETHGEAEIGSTRLAGLRAGERQPHAKGQSKARRRVDFGKRQLDGERRHCG